MESGEIAGFGSRAAYDATLNDKALTAAIGNHPVFIITTKQERFVELLLGHHRIELAGERIFGLERKRSKPEILTELAGRAEFKTAVLHLIEDRLGARESVM